MTEEELNRFVNNPTLEEMCTEFVRTLKQISLHVPLDKCQEHESVKRAHRLYMYIKDKYPKINVIKILRSSEETWKEEYEPYLNKILNLYPHTIWDMIFRRKRSVNNG